MKKQFENYFDKLAFFFKTIKYDNDTKKFFEDDEEMLSFVVRELGSTVHNINTFSARCTVYMLKQCTCWCMYHRIMRRPDMSSLQSYFDERRRTNRFVRYS